ncbi:hypothetical protein H1S01_07545 [Heliobacterium chlorum]|uniref:Uncharacterized protein n=1 Tax=Heliobacterium chlorum TaxID=2698 RepID=A0ABR7T0P4_HELCL|nr:hypothetical protein [Heliobacterium chlorum]MBC9784364.1 hypothetical protein [Heliobacterium chlorum]
MLSVNTKALLLTFTLSFSLIGTAWAAEMSHEHSTSSSSPAPTASTAGNHSMDGMIGDHSMPSGMSHEPSSDSTHTMDGMMDDHSMPSGMSHEPSSGSTHSMDGMMDDHSMPSDMNHDTMMNHQGMNMPMGGTAHDASSATEDHDNDTTHGMMHGDASMPNSKGLYKVTMMNPPAWTMDETSIIQVFIQSADGQTLTPSALSVQFLSQESSGHEHGATSASAPVIDATSSGNGEYTVAITPNKEGNAALVFTVQGSKGTDAEVFPIHVRTSPPNKWFLGGFSLFVAGTLMSSTILRNKRQLKEV